MHISTPSLLALLATLTPSTAFVIDTYSTQSCSTAVQTRVNTWDNTCATWPRGFKSFRIRTWGGRAQRAYFFAPNNCGSLPDAIGKGIALLLANEVH
ncbi:hypothetical protein C7974DRAFT_427933 [Boeremia exigua]|uniref:uncharacterized protein n=1 Tax=Boeremia exigua TaxID=749465 RepID=UPI001E8DAFD5|nr:uncharacterized protein C7974DRAFT_427933 [Boeremia exigua]KAH6614946.1 hypothetical protein C7974DRAFT_427933 [Boeremia exigua]